jgi:hypothetical protein
MGTPADPDRFPMPRRRSWGAGRHRSPIMFDVIYLLLGLGGFAACLGFVRLCELL